MEITVETLDKGLNKIKEHLKNNSSYEGLIQEYHIAEQSYYYGTSRIKETVLYDITPSEHDYIYGKEGSILVDNESNIVSALKYIESIRVANLGLSTSYITEIYLQVTKGLMFGNKLKKEYTDYLFLKGITPISYGINNLLTEIEDFYYDNRDKLNAVELAVRVHNLYLNHFPSKAIGNGQTARLIMNYILMLNGMKPFKVGIHNIKEYEETVLEDLEYGTDNFYNSVLEEKLDEVNNTIEEIRIITKFKLSKMANSDFKNSDLKQVVNSSVN